VPVLLSVDVEDWAQSTLDTSLPIYPHAQRNTEYLLDVAAESGRKLTCFILGRFAEVFPDTVRRIAREGHEVASHGYGHINVYEQTEVQFRQDILRSKQQLEDLTGAPVLGYRSPNFSLGKADNWALRIVAEEGFSYDSSIFPSPTYRHGRANWPGHPELLKLSSGQSLLEFPAATLSVFGRIFPVAGGGYHRLLPWPLIRMAVSKSLRANKVFTLYCHPYEFDPQEFNTLPLNVALKMRLHQGLGRKGFEGKFRKLLGSFETTTARDLLNSGIAWPERELSV
jgi:polysaccharide deacetylase family protein (PEP-CTERM system associated)